MENNKKIEMAVDFINQTHQGYGNYFFKKWKKEMNDAMFPVPLLYITAYEENEFTKDFYYYVRDLEVDLGCGEQFFLDVLVEKENELKLASFKSLMTQLATDYIKNKIKSYENNN